MTTDQEIGERMRAARGRMPQQHIATVMTTLHGHAWHQTTVAKVERGDRPLKLTEAVAVAEIIGVPLDVLVGQEPTRLERGARLEELRRLQDYIDSRETELREI